MIFVLELFKIPFRRENHVPKGAPEDFYPNNKYQYLRYSSEEMDAFVAARPDTWPLDLTLVDLTVRNPDMCAETFPKSIAEERAWSRTLILRRHVKRKDKTYFCECRLMNVDGRFCVPIVGPYAPLIKEE